MCQLTAAAPGARAGPVVRRPEHPCDTRDPTGRGNRRGTAVPHDTTLHTCLPTQLGPCLDTRTAYVSRVTVPCDSREKTGSTRTTDHGQPARSCKLPDRPTRDAGHGRTYSNRSTEQYQYAHVIILACAATALLHAVSTSTLRAGSVGAILPPASCITTHQIHHCAHVLTNHLAARAHRCKASHKARRVRCLATAIGPQGKAGTAHTPRARINPPPIPSGPIIAGLGS